MNKQELIARAFVTNRIAILELIGLYKQIDIDKLTIVDAVSIASDLYDSDDRFKNDLISLVAVYENASDSVSAIADAANSFFQTIGQFASKIGIKGAQSVDLTNAGTAGMGYTTQSTVEILQLIADAENEQKSVNILMLIASVGFVGFGAYKLLK